MCVAATTSAHGQAPLDPDERVWNLDDPEVGALAHQAPIDPDERVWYAWQNLILDGTGALLVGTAVVLHDNEDAENLDSGLALLGGSVLVLGSPIVHWAHRNPIGFISLGLRGTSLLLLAMQALAGLGCIDYEGEGSCGDGKGALVLAVLHAVAAPIVDMVFGFERRDATRSRSGLRPAVTLGAQFASLGLQGDF